jgi:hypothetical protein
MIIEKVQKLNWSRIIVDYSNILTNLTVTNIITVNK